MALLMLFLMGMGALGTEVVFLFLMHRSMQSAADAAALGGATALATGHPTSPTVEARAVAAAAGFVDGVNSTTVTVNNPPSTGPRAGDPASVEVIIDQPQTLGMISLFGPATYDVGTRAVATAGAQAKYCILSLDPSASQAILVNNRGLVANPNCGVAANSTSPSALRVENNARVDGPVWLHGAWAVANNGILSSVDLRTYQDPIADPYAGVSAGTPPACTAQSGAIGINQTVNLSPGHFCNGLNLGNGSTANLAAGTYYIDQQFTLRSSATLNATHGTTLIINGNYAVAVGNNTLINVIAPTSGTFSGLALFGPSTTASIIQNFNNNTTLQIVGAIYFPNQTVEFAPGTLIGPSICTQVVARIIQVYNNAYLNNRCVATGVTPLGSLVSQLVE